MPRKKNSDNEPEVSNTTGVIGFVTISNKTYQKQVLNFMLKGQFSSLTLAPKSVVRVRGERAVYETALSQFVNLKIISVK